MNTDIVEVSRKEFEILLDFMPEFNRPTGDYEKMEIDWNTIMPVVKKIYSFQKGKWHDKTRGIATDVWLSFQEKIDINETWKEVVKAITILNDQPKTNK